MAQHQHPNNYYTQPTSRTKQPNNMSTNYSQSHTDYYPENNHRQFQTNQF